jgi:hypothetical protein
MMMQNKADAGPLTAVLFCRVSFIAFSPRISPGSVTAGQAFTETISPLDSLPKYTGTIQV